MKTCKQNSKQLEQARFKYLSETITNEGNRDKGIEIHIAQAKSMFIKLNDIFRSRNSLDLRL